jgi:hypothetical protein
MKDCAKIEGSVENADIRSNKENISSKAQVVHENLQGLRCT